MKNEKEILETLGGRISLLEFTEQRHLKEIEELTLENEKLKQENKNIQQHNVNLIIENAKLKDTQQQDAKTVIEGTTGTIIENNLAADKSGDKPETRGAK